MKCDITVVNESGQSIALVLCGGKVVHVTRTRKGKGRMAKSKQDAEAWCIARGIVW